MRSFGLVMTSLSDRPSVRSTFHVKQYAKCRTVGTRVDAWAGTLRFFGGRLHAQRTAFDTCLSKTNKNFEDRQKNKLSIF